METIIQQFLFGITVGSTYSLVALGFSMQFRAMNLLNFSHGESFMVGAFIALLCHVFLKLPLAISWAITMMACGIMGLLIERLAIRPLYSAPPLNLLICTIGLSMILRQTANILSGAMAYKFPPTVSETAITLGGVSIIPEHMWVLGMTVLLIVVFALYLKKTRTGKAMRAVAQDSYTASLMGISVRRTKSLVYAVSTMLGGAAGILFAPLAYVTFDMGLWAGIKGFICAIVGGIGSIPGAILGGFILGLLEQFDSSYISSLYKDVISFFILILVIAIRPKGLLIRSGREKV